MARFVVEKHNKRQPQWLLAVLAYFPYDRKASYSDMDIYLILGNVLEYLQTFTYKRRNSVECLGTTHNIRCTDSSITVSTVNDVPYLTIHLIAED